MTAAAPSGVVTFLFWSAEGLPPWSRNSCGAPAGTPCIRENRGWSLAEVECSWRR